MMTIFLAIVQSSGLKYLTLMAFYVVTLHDRHDVPLVTSLLCSM